MAKKIYLNGVISYREDTLENWQTKNPLLNRGEPAFVRDDKDGKWLKVGDGVTRWNDLPYKSMPNGNGGSGTPVKVDQTYNPTSENAQSGIAVAEAISTKANLQMTELNADEFYYNGGVEPLEGTHVYEVIDKLGGGEVCFTGGLTLYTDVDTKIGCKYLITSHLDAEVGWQITSIIELVDLSDKVNTSDVQQNYNPAGANANKPVSAVAVSEAIIDMITVNDVDKEFIPESDNPQSGKAVAEALVEKWVQIADKTLEENSVLNITQDMNGNSFALKKFIVILSKAAVEGNTAKSYPWVKAKTTKKTAYAPFVAVEGGASYADNVASAWRYEGEIKHAWQTTWYATQDSGINTMYSYRGYTSKYGIRSEFKSDNTPLTAFQFTWGSSGALPIGTRVEIWGVRA